MQLTEGSCFFRCFLKQFFVDVYSTTEITRLTNQREEFLVLYIYNNMYDLPCGLSWLCAELKVCTGTQNLGKKKFNLWRLQATKINEFEISVSL